MSDRQRTARPGRPVLRRASAAAPQFVSSELWLTAWKQGYQANYYQSPMWAELWAKLVPHTEPAAVCLQLQSGLDVVVPLMRERAYRGLLERMISNPSGSQTAWLAPRPLELEETAELVSRMLSGFRDLRWSTTPLLHAPATPAPPNGGISQLIGLTDGPDAVRAGWSKGHRAAYTQGLRAGIEVRRSEAREDWARFHDLYLETIERWRSAGEPVTSLYPPALFDGLRTHEGASLWVARRAGSMLAGGVFLYTGDNVIYYHSVVATDALPLRPMNVLLGDVMLHASNEGLQSIDLGASGGHAGVAAFKRRFGAADTHFGTYTVGSRRSRWLRVACTALGREGETRAD